MKKNSVALSILVTLALVSTSGFAEGTPSTPKTTPQFDAIKSLQGTWVGNKKVKKGEEAETVQVKYKVTSAGSAVEETLFPGTPKEMVSVYTVDNGKILMTHYCALGNQPRMKMTDASKSKKGERIQLQMVDATGMNSPQDPHMGALTLTIQGEDKLVQEWVFSGPEGDKQVVFLLEREK